MFEAGIEATASARTSTLRLRLRLDGMQHALSARLPSIIEHVRVDLDIIFMTFDL